MIINTNLRFGEWTTVFGDAKMTIVLVNRLTHRCQFFETGNDRFRVNNSATAATHKGREAES
ncbi:ATP-binding protein [Allosediminivita pacifica]|uniref:ATP-binding protein n=1 Tax=Allosediminivita pacifica TaxID=1267769 RepID=UPI000D3BD4CD